MILSGLKALSIAAFSLRLTQWQPTRFEGYKSLFAWLKIAKSFNRTNTAIWSSKYK